MRAYLAVGAAELRALRAGESITAPAFLAASLDEEDELAALEEAGEHGAAVAAADLEDPDGVVELTDIASFHLDADGSGHLAWYAVQELDAVLDAVSR